MPVLMAGNVMTRRRRRGSATEVVAAAAEFNLVDPNERLKVHSILRYSRRDAATLWGHHDNIGEVHYAVSRSARIAGYAEIGIAEVREDGSTGDPITTGAEAKATAELYSRFGGTRGLVERFYALQKIPADAYLIRTRENGPGSPVDGFHFMSSDEIEPEDSTMLRTGSAERPFKWITLPSGRAEDRLSIEVPPGDFLGRVWQPSHRWIEAADSPLMALTTECEVLRRLTANMKARITSRFALNGVFAIPSEIKEAYSAHLPNKGGVQTDLLSYLIMAASMSMSDWESAQSSMPIFLRGPGEHLERIKHIVLDSSIAETDLKLRVELIGRILFGMDSQKGAVEGSSEQNHWGAWNESDEEKRIAVQPDLENLCWSLDRLALPKLLRDENMAEDKIARRRFVFHLDKASVRTNAQEDVRQAATLLVANAEAIARVTGLEKHEILSGDELIRAVGRELKNAYLATWGTKQHKDIDWTLAMGKTAPGPAGDSRDGDVRSGPGVGDPGSPNGQKRSTRPAETPA
jgi:hypothetical protein